MDEYLSIGMFLLLLCSTLTGLVTEALKKMMKITKPNITAAIVSIIVGLFVSVSWIFACHIVVNATTVLFCVSLIVLSWLCSMLGYDKVVQTLIQLFGTNTDV